MGYLNRKTHEAVGCFRSCFCTAVLLGTLPALAAASSLNVYLSAPGDQASGIANAATETFNSLPLGLQTSPYQTAIGTYEFSPTAPMAIVPADAYGGAYNTDYLSLGRESHSATPVALDLYSPATYFGFWWSAGDINNDISFYYNTIKVGHINTADLVQLLNSNGGMVTALNGSQYAKDTYYGNPNSGADRAEPFGYVNVFAQGTGFNRIVFDNTGATGTGLESDNHTVFLGAAQPKGASVFVESAPAISISLTPEPAWLCLAGSGLLGVVLLLRRRGAPAKI